MGIKIAYQNVGGGTSSSMPGWRSVGRGRWILFLWENVTYRRTDLGGSTCWDMNW